MRALLGLSVVVATLIRVALVLGGPDLDTDAYGHAVIGRTMLLAPTDLRVHWVWLPLWHGVHAVFTSLGGGLQQVRWLDVALSAAAPWMLWRLLRRAGSDETLAALSGALLALWPLGLLLGQSAEPEPLFLALTLGAALAWQEERALLAGLALATAALCRYEAWVLPPVYLALWWRRGRVPWQAVVWLLPGAAIVGWCAAQARESGELLRFLRDNREFAVDANARLGFPWGREARPGWMAIWYLAVLPFEELRWFFVPVVGGAVVAARRRLLPAALVAPTLTILGFVTYSWVRQLNLGLHRHFYAAAPLYAAVLAVGLIELVRQVQTRLPRTSRWPLVPLALVGFALARTVPHARWVSWAERQALLPERAAADALRGARAASDRFVIESAEIEILSGVPWRQIERRPLAGLTAEEARGLSPGGAAWLVGRPTALASLRSEGEVVHDGAWVVLRLPAR